MAIIGFSQGTTQTLAGMGAIPDWYDDNISISVMLGPGTTPNTKYFEAFTEETVNCFKDNNICVMAGPNWEKERPIIMAQCPTIFTDRLDYYETAKNTPIQAVAHYAQTAFSNRF